MPHRVFRDHDGVEWTVWDVHPSIRERLPQVANQLRDGWLAMHDGQADRRRVAPIPPGWERLSDDELRVLLGRAERRTSGPVRSGDSQLS